MSKITVCDISGMGGREFGGYEWGCQVICLRALRFMQEQKSGSQAPHYKAFENITGLIIPEGEAAKAMDKYILEHPKLQEFGMTGAMHQFGIAHAMKLRELGREKYLAEARTFREPEDFYEFEDEDAFPELVPAGKGSD